MLKGVGVGHTFSKVGGASWHSGSSHSCLCVQARGQKKEMMAQLFFSWRSFPKITIPPAQALRLVKQISLQYALGAFQTAASMVYLCGDVWCTVSFRVEIQFLITLLALPELIPLIFKIPGVNLSPTDFSVLCPSAFQSQLLWRLIFPVWVSHPWGTWCEGLVLCLFPAHFPSLLQTVLCFRKYLFLFYL